MSNPEGSSGIEYRPAPDGDFSGPKIRLWVAIWSNSKDRELDYYLVDPESVSIEDFAEFLSTSVRESGGVDLLAESIDDKGKSTFTVVWDAGLHVWIGDGPSNR